MITKTLVEYLEDEKIELDKKTKMIDKLCLNYSDVFTLMDMFRGKNTSVYIYLHNKIAYDNSSFAEKIKYSDNKMHHKLVNKKIKKIRREKSYD